MPSDTRLRRATAVRTPVVLLLAGLASGCLSDGGDDHGFESSRLHSWHCGDDGRLTVRYLAGAVDVNSPRGVEVRLPASPPGQTARYGEPPYALVIDGREALWFVTGKRPISCRD